MRQSPVVAVVVADEKEPPDGLDQIRELADVRVVSDAAGLAGADVVFLWDFRTDLLRDAWPDTGRLRWIQTSSLGVDAVPLDRAAADGVTVTNARGIFERPLAEYVLALLLMLAKDLHTTLTLQNWREWRHRDSELVSGQRLLVLGAGGVGREITRLTRAAGMDVTVVARRARRDDEIGVVHPVEELDELLGEADAIVLALPLNDQTRGLLDAGRLTRTRPGVRLVNVGRGPLVDEQALLAALRSGQVGSAALDVFETEPLPPSHPFWSMSQVVVSPHMSSDRVGWEEAVVGLFAANLRRYLASGSLLHVVGEHPAVAGAGA